MAIILVNVIAVLLIIFVLWWFFGSRPKIQTLDAEKPFTVLVKNGVYEPAFIQVPAGKPIKLTFVREDATPCAEAVVFAKLDLGYPLPLHKKVDITIPPQQPGEIEFTCQMGMYRGKLIVVGD